MITIKDVAQRVGASTATVSYVINDKPRVSEELAQRVRAAIQELNYTPNGMARKFRRGRTAVIGFVADNISNRFPSRLVQGLATAAAGAHYNVVISDLHDDAANEPRALDLLVHEQVEGIVYCGLGAAEEKLVQIHRSGIPVVVVDKPPRSKALPSVLIDNSASTNLALKHLFDLGYRDIRYIGGASSNRNTALRSEAFRDFMKRHGMPQAPDRVLLGDYTLQHGFQATRMILQEKRPCRAIFCGDDTVAFGVMAALKAAGKRIPEDVAVVGFDNDPLAGVMDPGLTTIHYPMVEMGERAFQVFLALRDKRKRSAPHEWLKTQLIIRRSTDPTCRPYEDLEGGPE